MKKIVIDARESGTSTGRYVDKLIEYLHREKPKYQITVLTKQDRVGFIKNIAPGFEVLATPYKEFAFGEQIGFLRQLRGLKADLVHFGMVQQPVLYKGKTVTTMHDLTTTRFRNPSKNPLIFWVKQQVYKWVNRRVARRTARIITPSQFVKDDVVRFANITPEKITVTYEAADKITETAQPVSRLDEKSQFIMYVGRPMPHKNLPQLIEAFVLLQKKYPDLMLVLAGKTDPLFKQIANSVQDQGLTNIIFTGFVSEGQLRWLYERTAAYVFPSLSEGFGLPGLEAMIHGAPVVSSNATCLPEIYKDGALYFDPLDPSDMANKIDAVLSNKALAENLRRKGLVVAGTYSWERLAKQTLSIYEATLGR